MNGPAASRPQPTPAAAEPASNGTPAAPSGSAKEQAVLKRAKEISGKRQWEKQDLGKELAQSFVLGTVQPEVIASVARILTRLEDKLSDEHREELTELAGGKPLNELATDLKRSLDPAEHRRRAAEMLGLPNEADITEGHAKIARMEMTREAFKPFHNSQLCARLMEIKQQYR